ncbi:uncharacterized protein [Paramisgurnus dabryanus]|uniref:uncharacterized protein isoform X3 n=1 Tax=Paramisgurnus dabryanus TaxID=90735 RepID=UPI0031F34564
MLSVFTTEKKEKHLYILLSTQFHSPSKKKKNAVRLIQEHPESLANESPESRAQEHPESLALKHPESFAQKRPESLVQEHPESLAQKHSESFVQKRPESLDQEHPESLAHECPQSLAQKHPKSLAQKHPESLAQEHPDRQRKRRIKNSSPPSSSFPYRKNKKGCQKCSRQKVFLFDRITGERINEGKAELKIHWLPCSSCGKSWDDTWEPAREFKHYMLDA